MKPTNELKKIKELNRDEKIALLNRIKTGEITTDQLNSESIIVSEESELFAGLLVSVAYHKAGKVSPVVLFGKAKELMKKTIDTILEKRQKKTK